MEENDYKVLINCVDEALGIAIDGCEAQTEFVMAASLKGLKERLFYIQAVANSLMKEADEFGLNRAWENAQKEDSK